jgi:hypothetical protein
MGSISLQVINEKDYDMVLAVLKPLIDNKIIRILEEDDDVDSIALPGKPMTDEELLAEINKAEDSPIVSGEEAKLFFDKLIEEPEKVVAH